MADPGFPVGGRAPVRGGMDLRRGHFSVKMYAKTKELGPIGGACAGHTPLDLPMINITLLKITLKRKYKVIVGAS